MDIWLTVLLAWLGINIVLVALMWRYETLKARNARNARDGTAHAAAVRNAYADTPSTNDSTALRPRRVVALTTADSLPQAGGGWAARASGASHACASSPMPSCRLHELHDEIRILKLTVAELSLDKAMLSAAARRKVSP